MYLQKSGYVLGFHGCDETVRDGLLKGEIELRYSTNDWDWLGHGMYFWEASYLRAYEYAVELMNNPHKMVSKIEKPAVIGAVIDLGYCLDLLQHENLKIIKQGYESLNDAFRASGLQLPKNKTDKKTGDLLIRPLDCLVVNSVLELNKTFNLTKPYDSVRGVFFEGSELYENAGFNEKNHIQINVQNPNCIKGYFLPREMNKSYPRP